MHYTKRVRANGGINMGKANSDVEKRQERGMRPSCDKLSQIFYHWLSRLIPWYWLEILKYYALGINDGYLSHFRLNFSPPPMPLIFFLGERD